MHLLEQTHIFLFNISRCKHIFQFNISRCIFPAFSSSLFLGSASSSIRRWFCCFTEHIFGGFQPIQFPFTFFPVKGGNLVVRDLLETCRYLVPVFFSWLNKERGLGWDLPKAPGQTRTKLFFSNNSWRSFGGIWKHSSDPFVWQTITLGSLSPQTEITPRNIDIMI